MAAQGRGKPVGVPPPLLPADAYFAPGDYVTAGEKAKQAVEIDSNPSQAWFIRVMVLLQQRNAAATLMQRHEINAVELAEPMSAHETMKRDLADDAGSRAYDYQESVPEAIEVSSSGRRPCEYWRQDEPGRAGAQVLTSSEREALELVRGDLAQCTDIALYAQSLTGKSTSIIGRRQTGMDSREDDSLQMPIGCELY